MINAEHGVPQQEGYLIMFRSRVLIAISTGRGARRPGATITCVRLEALKPVEVVCGPQCPPYGARAIRNVPYF